MDIEQRIERSRKRYHEAPLSRNYAPLADLLRQAGRFDEALDLLEEGLGRHPDYVTGKVILGHTLFEANRPGEARIILQQALARDTQNILARELLIAEAEKRDAWGEAVTNLEKLAVLDPEEVSWAFRLDAAREKLRAKPSEMPAVEKEDIIEQSSSEAQDVFEESSDQEILPEPEQGLSDKPSTSSFATMTMVEIYLKQGYRTRALAALTSMLEENPGREDVQKKIDEINDLGEAAGSTAGDFAEKMDNISSSAKDQLLSDGRSDKPGPGHVRKSRNSRAAKRDEEKKQFEEWLNKFPSRPGGEN